MNYYRLEVALKELRAAVLAPESAPRGFDVDVMIVQLIVGVPADGLAGPDTLHKTVDWVKDKWDARVLGGRRPR